MRVTLTSPFPTDALPDLFRWLSTSTIAKGETFPPDMAAFQGMANDGLSTVKSWTVHHEGQLIGAVMFEPVGLMGGRSYVVSSRSVWGSGLMDEAAALGITRVFEENQQVQYIFGMVVGNNAPAIAFNLRIGMKLKNILPDYASQGGKLRDMHVYEMTRADWEARRIFEQTRPKWNEAA